MVFNDTWFSRSPPALGLVPSSFSLARYCLSAVPADYINWFREVVNACLANGRVALIYLVIPERSSIRLAARFRNPEKN